MSYTLFLAGDVMPGRGVDQVLPHSCAPRLYEPWATSALDYVEMAERAHGPVPSPVGFEWVWGDLLEVLRRRDPDARIVNLESAVTTSGEAAEGKGIHYRMHPGNTPLLTAAGVDVCVLANNHVLDWGLGGFRETLEALGDHGLTVAGAGRDVDAASEPAVLPVGPRTGKGPAPVDGGSSPGVREEAVAPGRIVVLGVGGPDSGIPPEWAAGPRRPGVHFVADYSGASVGALARVVERVRRPGDIVVVSIHWGPNWGYDVSRKHRRFAHALIEEADVHLIHGHSSHHPMAAEVHRGRLVLYGCGDLVTDYEGISGHEAFRGDLGVAYFPTVARDDGRLLALELEPFQMRNFRLRRPSDADRAWLLERLRREYGRFGVEVRAGKGGVLSVGWSP